MTREEHKKRVEDPAYAELQSVVGEIEIKRHIENHPELGVIGLFYTDNTKVLFKPHPDDPALLTLKR